MTFEIILGFTLFAALLMLFLFLMPRSSSEAALLDPVARDVRQREGAIAGPGWQSSLNVDRLALPFTFVRSFFSAEPNPDLVKRLSLAGYRKPSHADIFLGTRLA